MSRPSVKERWICPRCKNKLALNVKTSEPPICKNPVAHGATGIKMTRQEPPYKD